MELNVTNRTRRTEALLKAEAAGARTAAVRAPLSQTRTTSTTDKLTLSRQCLSFLEAQNRKMAQKLAGQKSDSESSSEGEALLDYLEKGTKTLDKCQKIASRIMAGDKVPPEDLRYLMKNDMDGYRMALASRKPKKDPKEWKSVLDDEDRAELSSGEASFDAGSTGAAEKHSV